MQKKFLASDAIKEATQGGDKNKAHQIQQIEDDLLRLNLDKDKFKAEFDKIPESAKKIAQLRRRQFLEAELKIINKSIG